MNREKWDWQRTLGWKISFPSRLVDELNCNAFEAVSLMHGNAVEMRFLRERVRLLFDEPSGIMGKR